MHSQKLGAFLSQASDIQSLMPKAKRLLELQRVLSTFLPGTVAQATTVANYRQGKVVIYARNGAIAAKLKLLAPDLRDRLSKQGFEVTGIEVDVQPPASVRSAPPKTAKVTPEAAEALERLAGQLPDSNLKTLVASIAAKGRRAR